MTAFSQDPSPHDSEVAAFLERVVELSARRKTSGPSVFITEADALGVELERLRTSRSDADLSARFEAFADSRFALVDESHEYSLAADEVLVLSTVLSAHPELATAALKRGVIRLSEVLLEDDVPGQFKRLLERLRRSARQLADPELTAWVNGVIDALPGDQPA